MKFGTGPVFLTFLSDVDSSALADGQVLVYDDVQKKWIPTSINVVGGGASYLNDLIDVNTAGYQDGWVIQYDSTSGKWIAVDGSGIGGGTAVEQDVIGFAVDSNRIVKTGSKAFRELPYNATILGWKLVTDTDSANSVKISIQSTNDYSIYTEVISTEPDKPQLSAAKSAEDFTLTNWTTQINKTEILRFTVDEATNIKQLHFFLTIERYIP